MELSLKKLLNDGDLITNGIIFLIPLVQYAHELYDPNSKGIIRDTQFPYRVLY